MPEIKVYDRQAYCERCGKAVPVKEKPGDPNTAQLPHVLVDDPPARSPAGYRPVGEADPITDEDLPF